MAADDGRELALRVTVVAPPPGVAFRLRRGKADLVPPTDATAGRLTFDATVRVGRRPDGAPNLLGPFALGPPADRRLDITSGTLAGQADSCWTRAATVRLAGITWPLIESALATPGAVLVAAIAGTAKDGGPACASVPLLGDGWAVSDPAGA
jgi:hypothetical protein